MVNKDKITLVLLWTKYGGGMTSVNDLVRRLDRSRFNIIFIFLMEKESLQTTMDIEKYKVYKLSYSSLKRFRPHLILKLAKIFKDEKADIVHCHAHKATIYGVLAACLSKTPYRLIHVHGLRRSRTIRRKIINYLLFKRVNKILPVAESVRDDVLRL